MKLNGRYPFLIALQLLLLCSVASAEEDKWTIGSPTPGAQVSQQERPLPTGSILKWCEEKGDKVRYSQSLVPGYRLCGEIEANTLCDPSGKRFISKGASVKPSYAYKDCGLGQRIKVVRHDPLPPASEEQADQQSEETKYDIEPLPDMPNQGMSKQERAEAKKELARIQREQEGELAREMEAIMKELNAAFAGALGGTATSRKRRGY